MELTTHLTYRAYGEKGLCAMTEAEKKAKKKYRDKGKRLTLDFYPTEADLIEQIEKQPNKQGYIKNLIRADIVKQKYLKILRECIR